MFKPVTLAALATLIGISAAAASTAEGFSAKPATQFQPVAQVLNMPNLNSIWSVPQPAGVKDAGTDGDAFAYAKPKKPRGGTGPYNPNGPKLPRSADAGGPLGDVAIVITRKKNPPTIPPRNPFGPKASGAVFDAGTVDVAATIPVRRVKSKFCTGCIMA